MIKRVLLLVCIALVWSLEPYQADFQMFDANQDNKIDMQELVGTFPAQSLEDPGQFILDFMRDYDTNGDKVVLLEEYAQKRVELEKFYAEQNAALDYNIHEDF